MICQCDVCKTSCNRQARVGALPKEHQEYFNAMLDYIADLEYDNNYYKVVLNGEWPSADVVLKRALDKWECKYKDKE